MSYVVARMQKRKTGDLNGLQIHNDRKTKNHSNKDIDQSKSELNYDLVGHEKSVSYQKEIMNYINENKISTRAVRKDAVVVSDWLITSDKTFFENQTPEETEKFFKTAVNFFGERYGHENLKYATVHVDEKTPHMHLGIVPMRDGKLSAKTIFNRNELRDIQSELQKYFKENGFDLERGVEGSEAKYVHPEEYKKIENEMRMLVAESIVDFEKPKEEFTREMSSDYSMDRQLNIQVHVVFMEKDNIAPLDYFSKELSKLASNQKREREKEKKDFIKRFDEFKRKTEEKKEDITNEFVEFREKARELQEKIVEDQKKALRELSEIHEAIEKAKDEKALKEQKNAKFEGEIEERYKLADKVLEDLSEVVKNENDLLEVMNPYKHLTTYQKHDEKRVISLFKDNYNNLSSQQKIILINQLDTYQQRVKLFGENQEKNKKYLDGSKEVMKESAEVKRDNDDAYHDNFEMDQKNKILTAENNEYKEFIQSDKKIAERFRDFMQEKKQQFVQKYNQFRSH